MRIERPSIVQMVPSRTFRERHRTTEILVHKIGPHGARVYADVEAFFLRDPEGVGTVTVANAKERTRYVESWRERNHIPPSKLAAAHVPYHFLIDDTGTITQALPLIAHGAHAGGSNGRSVAVACIGDYEREEPTGAMLSSLRWMVKWLALDDDTRTLLRAESRLPLQVRGHDDVRELPKTCPGRNLLPFVRAFDSWLLGVQRQASVTLAD